MIMKLNAKQVEVLYASMFYGFDSSAEVISFAFNRADFNTTKSIYDSYISEMDTKGLLGNQRGVSVNEITL